MDVKGLNLKDLRQYRAQVLSSRLSGVELKCELMGRVEKRGQKLQDVYELNSFLLWHLAHCPKAKDREMVSSLAHEFERPLSDFERIFDDEESGAVWEPIPFSPARTIVRPGEKLWFEQVFPGAGIDWQETYHQLANSPGSVDLGLVIYYLKAANLLAKAASYYQTVEGFVGIGEEIRCLKSRLGVSGFSDMQYIFTKIKQVGLEAEKMFLIAKGKVPSYDGLMLSQRHLEDRCEVFKALQLALPVRNRAVGDSAESKFANFLAVEEINDFVRRETSEGEASFVFDISGINQPRFLGLFVKNNWPIGYAVAAADRPGLPFIQMAFHVFREYRGTISSSRFFRQFIDVINEQQRPPAILIHRGLAGTTSKRITSAEEEYDALTVFYLMHGFRWLQSEEEKKVMIKESPFR